MILEYYLSLLIILVPFLAISPWTRIFGIHSGIVWISLTTLFILLVIIDKAYLIKESIRKTPMMGLMMLFLIVNIASTAFTVLTEGKTALWSNNIKELGYLIFAVVFYWFIISFIENKEQFQRILRVFILSSAVAAVYCIVRLLFYFVDLELGAAQPWTVPRLVAPGGESQVMGSFIITSLPLVIASVLYKSTLLKKYTGILFSVILLFALVLTFSAGAWAGFGIGMIFLLLWIHYYNLKCILTVIMIFILAGGGVFLIDKTVYPGYLEGFTSITYKLTGIIPSEKSPEGKKMNNSEQRNNEQRNNGPIITESKEILQTEQTTNELDKYTESAYSNVERSWFRQAMLGMFKSSPFIGVGPGNFEKLYEQYRPGGTPQLPYIPKPHNQYLEILAETGLVGFLVFVMIILNFIYLLITHWNTVSDEDRGILLGMIASLMAVGVHGYAFGILVHIQVWVMLALTVSLLNMGQNGRISNLWRGSLS